MPIIIGAWMCPWEIPKEIEEISDYITQLNAKIQHIFREWNQLVDYLANLAFTRQNKSVFQTFKGLPGGTRKY